MNIPQQRRLRGPQEHVPVIHCPDGRTLLSRRLAVELSHRHPTVVHRAVEPVACHVKSRVLLVDLDELKKALAAIEKRRRRRDARHAALPLDSRESHSTCLVP